DGLCNNKCSNEQVLRRSSVPGRSFCVRGRGEARARGQTRMEATRSWQFGWLWAAYAISTFGTWIAFDALTMVAILMLHAGPTKVAIMAATGPAGGALVAVPVRPWR